MQAILCMHERKGGFSLVVGLLAGQRNYFL